VTMVSSITFARPAKESKRRFARTLSFRPSSSAALWTGQVTLAALFVFAGVMKFVMSAEQMTQDIDWPIAFLRFIGACEVLGGAALVVPGIVDVQRRLTPIAAAGLVIIMVGAVVSTIAVMGVVPALYPLAVGVVAATVLYGRRSWLTTR
jgi:uncharacterized membrane protein YphA (DoxX/SURF4 family)